jgi:hypothetical protein
MKTIIIKLNEDEYRKIEEKAKEEGYLLVSDYIKSLIVGKQNGIIKQDINEVITQLSIKLERKINDILNPFTSEIQDLKVKLSEVIERIEKLEEKLIITEKKGTIQPKKSVIEEGKKNISEKTTQQKQKKTAIEVLKEAGLIIENEVKVKNPDTLFEKLEKQGAKVIQLNSGRIAIHPAFWNNFVKKISEIHSADTDEVASKLDEKSSKLFKILTSQGLAYFDANSRNWKFLVD